MPSTKLGLYGILSRIWRKSSYSVKLLLVAILGMHTMLGSAIVLILPPNLDPAYVLAVIGLERAATFAVTIWLFWSLLTPIRATVSFLEEYLRTGKITELPTEYPDEVGRLMANTHRVVTELARASATDPLTGLANRRFAVDKLAAEWDLVHSGNGRAVLAMIDLDDLKVVNDEKGHHQGDNCLKILGAALREAVGDNGWVARWGGDEYLALFRNMDEDAASLRLESIRKSLQSEDISFSNGLSELIDSVDESLDRADMALYAAKRGGKGKGAASPAPALPFQFGPEPVDSIQIH